MKVTNTTVMSTGEVRVEFDTGRAATVYLENAQPTRIVWRGGTAWKAGQPVYGARSLVAQVLAAVAAL